MRGILRFSFGSGLERVDDMTGTDLRAVAALDTLGRIDLRHEILHMDRVGGAFPLALHAADAAHLADLHDLCAFVLVTAADHDLLALGDQLDNALGAGVHTGAAAHALGPIRLRDTVDDVHGVKLTGLHAVAQADAGEGAQLVALAAEQHGRAAILGTGIVEAGLGHVCAAGTGYKRHLALGLSGRDAHDLRHLGRGGSAAGHALIAGGLPCRHGLHDGRLIHLRSDIPPWPSNRRRNRKMHPSNPPEQVQKKFADERSSASSKEPQSETEREQIQQQIRALEAQIGELDKVRTQLLNKHGDRILDSYQLAPLLREVTAHFTHDVTLPPKDFNALILDKLLPLKGNPLQTFQLLTQNLIDGFQDTKSAFEHFSENLSVVTRCLTSELQSCPDPSIASAIVNACRTTEKLGTIQDLNVQLMQKAVQTFPHLA